MKRWPNARLSTAAGRKLRRGSRTALVKIYSFVLIDSAWKASKKPRSTYRIRPHSAIPSKIGFFSFSRKAAEEARDRAARNLGLDVKQMHHFRTLHSLAFRQLGLSTKDVINASDFKTLEKALGVEFQSTMSMKLEDGEFFRIGRDGDFYLTAYNLARVKGTDPMREFGRVQRAERG